MTQLMVSSMIFITGIVFLQMNHPLAMGLVLLLQTTLICLITGMIAKSFWFSYILFLVFLGGMLVLFIYVTSLASNEMFSLSFSLLLFSIILLIISLLSIYLIDKTWLYTYLLNSEMNSYNSELWIMENALDLFKLYNYPTNFVTILLMNYLLITLIAVVKITDVFYGPLRPMN